MKHQLHALTSLRFFAAAMIVVTHADPLFGSFGLAEALPLGQGVSFFFVLSGFILAYNYRDFSRQGSIARFFVARLARVWPLHLVTCFLWIALIYHFDRAAYFGGVEGTSRFIANILLLQSWVPLKLWALSFNGVSWSISIELFFYLLFPAVVMLWSRYRVPIWTAAALVVIAFIVLGNIMTYRTSDSYEGLSLLGTVYFNPAVRFLEFLFGMSLAKLFLMPRIQAIKASPISWLLFELGSLGVVAWAMLAVATPELIESTLGIAGAYYFKREGIWLAWGLLIMVFALSRGPLAKALSVKPLVYLGEISFALYLVHGILVELFEEFDAPEKFGSWSALLFWCFALLFAWALHFIIENPFRMLIMKAWDSRSRHQIKSSLSTSIKRIKT